MFGIKNILNWSSVIFILFSIYLSINLYSYNLLNEAFMFEGIAILMFIFMTYIMDNLPSEGKGVVNFIFALIFSSIFLTLNSYLIIPLTFAFLYYFRNNLYFVFGGLAFTAFTAYSINSFILFSDKINITIETLMVIPVFILVIFIIINFYLGWIIADRQELLFSSGLMIFILLLISSYYDSPIQNRFLLTIPLFLFSLKRYKVDRFLGKIYNSKEA